MAQLRAQADEAGIPAQVISRSLNTVKLNQRVIELDRSQPEFTSSFSDYYTRRVSETRIETGRKKYREQQPLLQALTREYGIPGHYLVVVRGTFYGRFRYAFR